MHPVEAGTVGLYRQPVAILDFASLYPSLYRAYNLDYATLLHPDDVAKMSPEDVITTPAGCLPLLSFSIVETCVPDGDMVIFSGLM
jgi:DNA polymerase elongation subunit (family B)